MKRKIALWALLGATVVGYIALIIVARWKFGGLASALVLLGAICGDIGYALLDALGDACDAGEEHEIVCPGCGARFELRLNPGAQPTEMPQNCLMCGSPLDVEAYLQRAETDGERRP